MSGNGIVDFSFVSSLDLEQLLQEQGLDIQLSYPEGTDIMIDKDVLLVNQNSFNLTALKQGAHIIQAFTDGSVKIDGIKMGNANVSNDFQNIIIFQGNFYYNNTNPQKKIKI